MAVPIHSSAPTSFFNTKPSISPPSLSCSTKVFVGLKPQNSSPFASAIPNLTAGFFDRASKSLHSRYGSKRTRGRVNMMPIGIPKVLRTSSDGSRPVGDVWSALYREGIIFIGDYIDEAFGNQILTTMLYLDSLDEHDRIYVYINGPGGDLTPSLALYDTMKSLNTPVSTLCTGFAYNMAGFLVAAGKKGHRRALPNSAILLESPAGAARGQSDDIRNEANEILRIKDYLYKELAKNTGQTVDKINEDLAQPMYFNAERALEYGLIDRIARPPRIKAVAPKEDSTAGLG